MTAPHNAGRALYGHRPDCPPAPAPCICGPRYGDFSVSASDRLDWAEVETRREATRVALAKMEEGLANLRALRAVEREEIRRGMLWSYVILFAVVALSVFLGMAIQAAYP